MRPRRLLALAAAFLPPILMAVACGFPDVAFGPSGGSDPDGAKNDGGPDATSDGPTPDAPTEDVLKEAGRSDAEQPVDPDMCEASTCDCDNDKYPDEKKSGSCAPGPNGKYDCDDLDPVRNPDAGYKGLVPDGQAPPGDWNCNSSVEVLYKTNLKCSGIGCGSSTTDQGSGTEGFTGNPACGVLGAFHRCQTDTIVGCKSVKVDDRLQQCK